MATRNLIDADDVKNITLQLIDKEKFNRIINVAYLENFSTTEILLILEKHLNKKPITKAVKGAPLQVDLSANFLYNDKFTLGVAYRWDAAVSGLAGFQISDSWFIGYAYDMEATQLSNYNSGSHELFLRFELLKNPTRVNPHRFF